MDYREFLSSKHLRSSRIGFDVSEDKLCSKLFEWQRKIVKWALSAGRAALFEDCGLGKTIQQLAWAEQIVKREAKPVLLLCPIAVGRQTIGEAEKFGINVDVKIVADQSQVIKGINIANYEKLHLFDCSRFIGVVLDESSVLKNFTGKTKRQLCDEFRNTRYKLPCTATPSPNDRMELGNHSEFLDVMPSNEMLARWFINSGDKVGLYRLRQHGAKDFWRWVSSWAVCIDKPSCLGFSDEGYTLPELKITNHVVLNDDIPQKGRLFDIGAPISATTVHVEKRATLAKRADKVAELVNSNDHSWAIWCDTDYEADALSARIPDSIEVRGSHSPERKETMLDRFSNGLERVIITKAEIAGFGMNWQHCCHTTWFAGYSYEKFYQAIRRLWRFGQKNTVEVHNVMSEGEESIADVLGQKSILHEDMKCEMAEAMKEGMLEEIFDDKKLKQSAIAAKAVAVPSWIKSKH